ncbi:hypothetical protein ON010_g8093 [Phytophthora cinnamomi]|nr:hypothetical protein ON010_g8093 [Phytophthora cinnamomi]
MTTVEAHAYDQQLVKAIEDADEFAFEENVPVSEDEETEDKVFNPMDIDAEVRKHYGRYLSMLKELEVTDDLWVVDTGAVHAVSPSRHWFSSLGRGQPHTFEYGNRGTSLSTLHGTVRFSILKPKGYYSDISIKNVAFDKECSSDLLCAYYLATQGYWHIQDKSGEYLYFLDKSNRLLLSVERAVSRLQLKVVMMIMDGLGKVIQFSSARTDLPLALSDSVLVSAWLDLKSYVDRHEDDGLLMMQQYVKNCQSLGRQGSLETLLGNFEEEMLSFRGKDTSGAPPRSDESWAIFAEVGEVLADWIGSSTLLNSNEAKRMRSMFHELKKFDAEYPDRVPPYLFQNARLQDKLCRSQRKYAEEIKLMSKHQQW